MASRRVVTVFGASGFIGRHLVRRLGAAGAIVRACATDVERAAFLKPMGDVGQIVPTLADIRDPAQVARAVEGAHEVVNLVGILYERGSKTFQAMHVDGAKTVAEAAAKAGVRRLVHMSALGADAASNSVYAKTKALGEAAVRAAFPGAAIARPSVVFGPEDDFFNRFARLAVYSPVLPVFTDGSWKPIVDLSEPKIGIDAFGPGGTKFQPVYVGDVADALMAMLDKAEAAGRTYELAGPEIFTMKALLERVLVEIRRKKILLPLPFWVAALQAEFLQYLPVPPLTPDQVRLLRHDNVAGGKLPGLKDLGIEATTAEAILPLYLKRFRPQGGHTLVRGSEA